MRVSEEHASRPNPILVPKKHSHGARAKDIPSLVGGRRRERGERIGEAAENRRHL